MKKIHILISATFLLLCLSHGFSAQAQNMSGFNPDKNQPLEITAEQTLEWHRNTQQYIARGNVVAKQGNTIIKADVLTADYREKDGKNFDIYRLTAAGNVIIESRGSYAYGNRASYNIDQGVAIMVGDALRMTSADQVLTAHDSFEYWVAEGRFNALGKAKLVRAEDTITADKMTAFLAEDKEGKRQLKRLEAHKNVVITTPTETLRGDEGVYNAATNTAEITGAVKIERGPNILEGARAEVNLTTNISKMYGAVTAVDKNGPDTGRVRGIFYPGSETTPEKTPVK